METINSLVGVLLRTAIEWVCFRRLLFSSVTMVMKLITSFLFKHVLVTYKSVPEKSPWACIPNFCHSAFNLEYRRDVCSWSCHYLLQDSVFLYVLQESKGKQTRYFIHLSRIWSCTVALCQLCFCSSEEERLPLWNRLLPREGLGVQRPAKFPISYGERPFVFGNCKSARQSPRRNSPHENKAVLYLKP